jgi:hypothetical protein
MKNYTLQHAFQYTSRAEVLATISDFAAFVRVHPLIYEATLLPSLAARVDVYAVKERVKLFGLLPMHPRYRVHVARDGDAVLQSARIMGIMDLRIRLTFEKEGDQGLLLEKIEVTQIPLLTAIFWRLFQQAHTEAFARLRQQIEGRGGA